MTTHRDEQDPIRLYLLGKLAGEEREAFEYRLFAEDELIEEIRSVEDELIDDYLIGDLSVDEAAMFEKNFLVTDERRQKLRLGKVFRRYAQKARAVPSKPIPSPAPLNWRQLFSSSLVRAAAFAAVILIVTVGAWRIFFYESEVDKGLLALKNAYREQRPVEARITQFDYAPYSSPRGSATEKVDQNELSRAELTLLEALKKNPTPDAHHALGKVFLARKEFDKAIEQFDKSLKGEQRNAQFFSDLGAAWLEKGKVDLERGKANPTGFAAAKAMEDFARSLENLTRARELNPELLEALFNLAILHEQMALPREAEEDWKKYLEKDSNSKWAEEARRHLTSIQEGTARVESKSGLLPQFVKASETGDGDHAYELLNTNTEAIAGQLLWWQLVEAVLDSSSRGESIERYQNVLRYAGKLQQERSADSFLAHIAEFYGTASPQQLSQIGNAHSMINEAHKLLAKSNAAGALKLYVKANVVFDSANDRAEALYVLYWIGYSHYRESNFQQGESLLTQVADRCKAGRYLWLQQKALTMIANIQVESGQLSKSIESYKYSLQISQKINDVYNVQKNLSSLANSYKNLGKREESLTYIVRCLKSADTHWTGSRQMYRNYYSTAGVLNSFGYHIAAAEYERAALALAIEEDDPVLQNQSYVRLATIYSKLRNFPEALKYATLSHEAAKRMEKRTSLRPTADAFLQLAHVNRQIGDHLKSAGYYDEAIKYYDGIKHFALLYEAHKGRLLDYIAQNKDSEAKAELQIVLDLFETHRWKIREERNRNAFFDMQQSVYEVAIDFEYSRMHDSEKAFEYSEVSRARSLLDLINVSAKATDKEDPDLVISSVRQPLKLKAIQARMSEEAQILQYAVLDDKLLIWVVSKTRFETVQLKIDARSLTEKVVSYCQLLTTGPNGDAEALRREGMELYELLIGPVESLLAKDKQIYVVPDKVLNSLAFNTLISPATRRYLVNDYLFAFTPSSNVFIVCTEVAREKGDKTEERLLSVGDPYFDRDAFPDLPALPASGKEATEIVDYYRTSKLLIGDQATKEKVIAQMGSADVIHLASHYVVNEQNPMLSELLLTRQTIKPGSEAGVADNLQAYEICNRRLPVTRLVTLSACRTGVERYYSGEGMIGMSRTFIAAGVPTVVASLWPVESDSTADLMTRLHKYRKQKSMSTAQALRQSQLDMIASTKSQPYYWAPFVLIGGYANF